MFSAHVLIIWANFWLVPFESLPVFKDSMDCYNTIGLYISELDQRVIDQIGIQNMECVFVPFPGKPNPRRVS